jgi:hypothetical protein
MSKEMRKTIDTFKNFILKESMNNFNEQLKDNFKKINISFVETYSDNLDLYMGSKKIGTLRFYIDENWLVIDNIELYNDYIGKGIGFSIYETLYKTSKEDGLNGFFSQLFSKEIGQKRSKSATKVLDKLINKYGGEKHDCSQWLSDEYKNDDDVYDYLIDGRGKVEIKIV